jgi:hypothetical protein
VANREGYPKFITTDQVRQILHSNLPENAGPQAILNRLLASADTGLLAQQGISVSGDNIYTGISAAEAAEAANKAFHDALEQAGITPDMLHPTTTDATADTRDRTDPPPKQRGVRDWLNTPVEVPVPVFSRQGKSAKTTPPSRQSLGRVAAAVTGVFATAAAAPTAVAAAPPATIQEIPAQPAEQVTVEPQDLVEDALTEVTSVPTLAQTPRSLVGVVTPRDPSERQVAIWEAAQATTATPSLATPSQAEATVEPIKAESVSPNADLGAWTVAPGHTVATIRDALREAGVLPEDVTLIAGPKSIIGDERNQPLWQRAVNGVTYGPDYIEENDLVYIPDMDGLAVTAGDTITAIAEQTGVEASLLQRINLWMADGQAPRDGVVLLPGNAEVLAEEALLETSGEAQFVSGEGLEPQLQRLDDGQDDSKIGKAVVMPMPEVQSELVEEMLPTDGQDDSKIGKAVVMPMPEVQSELVEEMLPNNMGPTRDIPPLDEQPELGPQLLSGAEAYRVRDLIVEPFRQQFNNVLGEFDTARIEGIAQEISSGTRNETNVRNFLMQLTAQEWSTPVKEFTIRDIAGTWGHDILVRNGVADEFAVELAAALVPYIIGDYDGTIKYDAGGMNPDDIDSKLQTAIANGIDLESSGDIVNAILFPYQHTAQDGQTTKGLADWYRLADPRITEKMILLANDGLASGAIEAGTIVNIPGVNTPPGTPYPTAPNKEPQSGSEFEDDKEFSEQLQGFLDSISGKNAQELAQMVLDSGYITIRDQKDLDELKEFIETGSTWVTECDENGSDIFHGIEFAPNLMAQLLFAAENGIHLTVIDFGSADAHSCTSFHYKGQGVDVVHSDAFFALIDKSIRNGNPFEVDELFHDYPPAGTTNWDKGNPHAPIGGHGTHDHVAVQISKNWNSAGIELVPIEPEPPTPEPGLQPQVPDLAERVKNVESLNGADEVLIEDFILTLHDTYGFTEQGAAWFTGALIWESGLKADAVGDDGNAIGIAQWWHFRRGADFPYGDVWAQLEYAVNEMKNNYPEAYRIYTDPNATDADLSRANKIYEGYGIKGERDVYGDKLEQQIDAQDGVD